MILDYSKNTKSIQEAYITMNQPKEYEIITGGGLGIFLGGLAGFLVGGPIGAIAGAYIGHRAQEMGVKQFLKNVVGVGGGVVIGSLGGPLGALAGGIGGYRLAKESTDEVVTERKKEDDTKEDKPDVSVEFKALFKSLDKFLKDKYPASLKAVKLILRKINTAAIVDKLDTPTKERLVKIYVFIEALHSLVDNDDKESKHKYNRILSAGEKDIAATAANMLVKK